MKKIITYTFSAVAVYLVVANGTAAGRLLTSGASAYSTAVKTLQGR